MSALGFCKVMTRFSNVAPGLSAAQKKRRDALPRPAKAGRERVHRMGRLRMRRSFQGAPVPSWTKSRQRFIRSKLSQEG